MVKPTKSIGTIDSRTSVQISREVWRAAQFVRIAENRLMVDIVNEAIVEWLARRQYALPEGWELTDGS